MVGIITATPYMVMETLTNLNAEATGWAQVNFGLGTGIYNSSLTDGTPNDANGIGTSVPRFILPWTSWSW